MLLLSFSVPLKNFQLKEKTLLDQPHNLVNVGRSLQVHGLLQHFNMVAVEKKSWNHLTCYRPTPFCFGSKLSLRSTEEPKTIFFSFFEKYESS